MRAAASKTKTLASVAPLPGSLKIHTIGILKMDGNLAHVLMQRVKVKMIDEKTAYEMGST